MERKEIIEACLFLRKNNTTIPDQTLDFIKDASLCVFDSLHDDYCKKCCHNGKQMQYPSSCTGCGINGEKRHFVLNVEQKFEPNIREGGGECTGK